MLAVRDINRHYLKEHRQLSEEHINEKIDDYVEYIRGKFSDLKRPKKILGKKTEEKAGWILENADGTKNKGRGMKRKEEVPNSSDSSSDNSSSGEESTNSKSETSSDEHGEN